MASKTSTDTTQNVHRCLSCGRPIRSAESIAAGRGSGCRAKIRRAQREADLSAWTDAQVESARELIEDGGIVPTAKPGVFRTVSTRGDAVYMTSAHWCGCPAKKECYHRAGVVIVLASHAPAIPARQPLRLAA
jgi:Family of unknown function (DUF6011)